MTALDTYEQGFVTLATDAGTAGASLQGTSNASYALNQQFYAQITAEQGVISALMQQGASTGDLTKVVATASGQMLKFAGNNDAARSVLVDLINNALGPGTVTLKNLNQWIGTNTTSLSGMNGIVAASTIKAGQLNGVLSTTLQNMQAIAIFQAHGGQQAWNTFSTDLINGKTNNKLFKQSVQDVMAQLYIQNNQSLPAAHRAFDTFITQDLGGSIKQADALWKTYLPGLQRQINSLKGKTVNIGLTATAAGAIHAVSKIPGGVSATSTFDFLGAAGRAGGGMVRGPGGPHADKIPIWASDGEFMIRASAVSKYGPSMLRAINAGRFAKGGMINLAGPENFGARAESGFGTSSAQVWSNNVLSEAKNLLNAYAKANRVGVGPGSPTGAAGGGSPAANAALARAIFPQYTSDPLIWNAWNYVAMRESGWNQFATNPSSGAYGIPQALPYNKMPRAAWPGWAGGQSDPRSQILWMWDYMASTYGGPVGAAAHEQQYNWYDNGGWLKPGMNYMMNGTGGWEHLSRDSGSGRGGVTIEIASSGNQTFDTFMLEWIRNAARIKGGGNVQTAFGRNK
jgi:hypothetical protein